MGSGDDMSTNENPDVKPPRLPRDPRAKGRWVYPSMVLDVAGVRFEVTATGTVYERTMRKPVGTVRRGDGAKMGPDDLIPGPLTRVKDEEQSAAVRDLIRAREQKAADLDSLMREFIAARASAEA